jgi:hypothetical protein
LAGLVVTAVRRAVVGEGRTPVQRVVRDLFRRWNTVVEVAAVAEMLRLSAVLAVE